MANPTAQQFANAERDLTDLSSIVNDPPGTVETRYGGTTDNMRKRLDEIGYYVPVAFQSGLPVTHEKFTVIYSGDVYAAKGDELPFTTTATFDPDQWRYINTDVYVEQSRSEADQETARQNIGVGMKAGQSVSANATLSALGNYWHTDEAVTAPNPITELSLKDAGFSKIEPRLKTGEYRHPLDGDLIVTDADPSRYLAVFSFAYWPEEKAFVRVVAEVGSHVPYTESSLYYEISYDFINWTGRTPMWSSPGRVPYSGRLHRADNGSFVFFFLSAEMTDGLASRSVANFENHSMISINLDSGFTLTDIPEVATAGGFLKKVFPHSQPIEHDGYIWFHGYVAQLPAVDDGDGYRDNGLAYARYHISTGVWSSEVCIVDLPAGANLAEIAVARADDSKFIGLVRDGAATLPNADNALRHNAYITTSTDLINFTTLRDSGYALGHSPTSLVEDGDDMWFITQFRNGNIDGQPRNTLCIGSTNRLNLYEAVLANTAIPQVPIIPTHHTEAGTVGYGTVIKVDGDWYTFFTAGEDVLGGGNNQTGNLAGISTRRRPVASPSLIRSMRPGRNWLFNGALQLWDFGDTFTALTADTMIMPGWKVTVGDKVPTITKEVLTMQESMICPHTPKFGMRITAASIVDDVSKTEGISFMQRIPGEAAVRSVLGRTFTTSAWFASTIPAGDFTVTMNVKPSAASSVYTQVNSFGAFRSTGGVWQIEITHPVPMVPDDATFDDGGYVDVILKQTSQSAINGMVLGIKMEEGDQGTALQYVEEKAERLRLSPFYEQLYWSTLGASYSMIGLAVPIASGAGYYYGLNFAEKWKTPTVTTVAGSNFHIRGNANTPTAYDYVSTKSARMILTWSTNGNTTLPEALFIGDNSEATVLVDALSW